MTAPARTKGSTSVMAERSPLARGMLLPAQSMLHSQAVRGGVLFAASLGALAWANSPWSQSYFDLRETEMSIDFGLVGVSLSLHHWINDGLMTIFFFAVGLEIKKEFLHGELHGWKKASLPVFAALGGMVLPALLYLAMTVGSEASRGWGIAMATDIAFALGLLVLLGERIPMQLRILLLALATVDDIGAILVIALVYTESLSIMALSLAAALLATVLLMQWVGIRGIQYYAFVGAAFWMALHHAGVHPTIGGVLLGVVTPATAWFSYRRFADSAGELIDEFTQQLDHGEESRAESLLGRIEQLVHETEAPLERLERLLQPWVSFLVLPLFGLANAGIALSSSMLLEAATSPVTLGVAGGLVLGKLVGIAGFSWLAVRTGMATLSKGISWSHLIGVAMLGGIGFTVSLFITRLAFEDSSLREEAKVGILAASLVAGVVGYGWLYWTAKKDSRKTQG
jgi:NhaA family Na+:H+ antiporter